MKRFRCALIGLGRMGTYHYQTISRDPRFELVAAVDPTNKVPSLKELALATPLFTSLDELFAEDIPFECAFVASPTETHFPLVKQLLERGVHVLVEKPAASTPEQCQRLVDLAARKGLYLAVGNIERCNPVIEALRDVLESGIIGVPVHINSTRAGGFPAHVKEGNNVLLDLAVHDLDVLQMILGELHVEKSIAHSTQIDGICDTAEVSLTNRDGITAQVHVNWLSPHRLRNIRVTGTAGVCEVNYIEQSCTVIGRDLDKTVLQTMRPLVDASTDQFELLHLEIERKQPLERQLDQFYRLLLGDQHILATGEQLVASVQLVELAVEKASQQAAFSFFRQDKWQPYFLRSSEPLLN